MINENPRDLNVILNDVLFHPTDQIDIVEKIIDWKRRMGHVA